MYTDNNKDFMTLLENDSNVSYTENGAAGYRTTRNALLDFSFQLTSMRNKTDEEITEAWAKVLRDNSIDFITKFKYIFYVRDILQGMGERRTGRLLLKSTALKYPESTMAILHLIPVYGRWDDILCLYGIHTRIDRAITDFIKQTLIADCENAKTGKSTTLLAKWLPSVNSHCKETARNGHAMAMRLGLSDRDYRKTLSALREYLNIVECNMSAKNYAKIDYSKVPSLAALKYKKAFMRNDMDRYQKYLDALTAGDKSVKVNAATTMPHEILHKYNVINRYDFGWDDRGRRGGREDALLEAAWKAMMKNAPEISSTIVVCDSSGSMMTHVGGTNIQAIEISNALAIYFAERLTGPFKDKFITFSSSPEFVNLTSCHTLHEKLVEASRYDDCSNTNLKAVFDMILATAQTHNLKQQDLPANVLIISDMEFDSVASNQCFNSVASNQYFDSAASNQYYGYQRRTQALQDQTKLFDAIAAKYEAAGYKMPKLIFNNVCSRTGTIPITQNENGVVLISGFSKNIIQMIMSEEVDPWNALLSVLNGPRYDEVANVLLSTSHKDNVAKKAVNEPQKRMDWNKAISKLI